MSADDNDSRRRGPMEDVLEYFDGMFKELEYAQSKKFKKMKRVVLQYKGNQYQYDFNEDVMDELEELKYLVGAGSQQRSSKKRKSVIKTLDKRNKCIKMADRSLGGWDTVKEYLSDYLASDSEDIEENAQG